MGLKETLDKELDLILKPYPEAQKVLAALRKDIQISYLHDLANNVTVLRMGYSDHGGIHARVVAFNAAKALIILNSKGVVPTLIQEDKKASIGDAIGVVVASAFLHDIGNSIMRDAHELFGMVQTREILERVYPTFNIHNEKKKCMIQEGILCHMGNYRPASIEAKLVPIADGCDMEEGRARIPYELGKKDIYALSALSIKKVRIMAGEKKPLKVYVEMDSSAGIFQIEELLLKKIKAAEAENLVEITANITSRNEIINYFDH